MSPGELLQRLIRFDTTNPPGNEAECIEFLRGLLDEAGIATEVYAKIPDRPNLVARIEGGDKAPLLLQGHVDVVTTTGQNWARPPFGGELVDGYVWGRGAEQTVPSFRRTVQARPKILHFLQQAPMDPCTLESARTQLFDLVKWIEQLERFYRPVREIDDTVSGGKPKKVVIFQAKNGQGPRVARHGHS